jgi:hypothetical protein
MPSAHAHLDDILQTYYFYGKRAAVITVGTDLMLLHPVSEAVASVSPAPHRTVPAHRASMEVVGRYVNRVVNGHNAHRGPAAVPVILADLVVDLAVAQLSQVSRAPAPNATVFL